LGLAIFVIAVLQRTWREHAAEEDGRREQDREDRARLLEVIKANTAAWSAATTTMAKIAECSSRNAQDLSALRTLLARRPCVGTDALIKRDD